ncbi:MAG: hypothetical protein M1818_007872 [Claussenomyces sp. TS43310]|nr:MAG: hypothetical protein M1818_007872 [Claussenomyces sp. TS43310]
MTIDVNFGNHHGKSTIKHFNWAREALPWLKPDSLRDRINRAATPSTPRIQNRPRRFAIDQLYHLQDLPLSGISPRNEANRRHYEQGSSSSTLCSSDEGWPVDHSEKINEMPFKRARGFTVEMCQAKRLKRFQSPEFDRSHSVPQHYLAPIPVLTNFTPLNGHQNLFLRREAQSAGRTRPEWAQHGLGASGPNPLSGTSRAIRDTPQLPKHKGPFYARHHLHPSLGSHWEAQTSEKEDIVWTKPFVKPLSFAPRQKAIEPQSDAGRETLRVRSNTMEGAINLLTPSDCKSSASSSPVNLDRKYKADAASRSLPNQGNGNSEVEVERQRTAAQRIEQSKRKAQLKMEQLFGEDSLDYEAEANIKANIEKAKAEKLKQKELQDLRERDRVLKEVIKDIRKTGEREKTAELQLARKNARKSAAEVERRRIEEKELIGQTRKRDDAIQKLEAARAERDAEEAKQTKKKLEGLEIDSFNRKQVEEHLKMNRKVFSALKPPARRLPKEADERNILRSNTEDARALIGQSIDSLFVESDEDVGNGATRLDDDAKRSGQQARPQLSADQPASVLLSSPNTSIPESVGLNSKDLIVRPRNGRRTAQLQTHLRGADITRADTMIKAEVTGLAKRLDAIEQNQAKEADLGKAHHKTILALFKDLIAKTGSVDEVIDRRENDILSNTFTEQSWRQHQTELKSEFDAKQLRMQSRFFSDKKTNKKRILARVRASAEKEAEVTGLELDEGKLRTEVEAKLRSWEEKRRKNDAKRGFTYPMVNSIDADTQESSQTALSEAKTVAQDRHMIEEVENETEAAEGRHMAMRTKIDHLRGKNAASGDFDRAASRKDVYLTEDESDISEEDPDSEPETPPKKTDTSDISIGADAQRGAPDGTTSLESRDEPVGNADNITVTPKAASQRDFDSPPQESMIHVYVVRKTVTAADEEDSPIRIMGRFTSLKSANACAHDVLFADEGGHRLNYVRHFEELVGNRRSGTLDLVGALELQVHVWVDVETDYIGSLVNARQAELDSLIPARVFSILRLTVAVEPDPETGEETVNPHMNVLEACSRRDLANQKAAEYYIKLLHPGPGAKMDAVLMYKKQETEVRESLKRVEEDDGVFDFNGVDPNGHAIRIQVYEHAVTGPCN